MNSSGVGDAAGGMDVAVGIIICVSTTAVLLVDMAGSVTFVGVGAGAVMKLLQDAGIAVNKNAGINVFLKFFIFQ